MVSSVPSMTSSLSHRTWKMNSSCESVLCIVMYCLPSHRTLSSSIPFQTCYLTVSSSNPLTVFRTSSQPHSRDNANSAVANSIRSRQNDDITQPTTKRFIVSYCRHIWCLFLRYVSTGTIACGVYVLSVDSNGSGGMIPFLQPKRIKNGLSVPNMREEFHELLYFFFPLKPLLVEHTYTKAPILYLLAIFLA